jgi:basic membrane protein A and related proteins
MRKLGLASVLVAAVTVAGACGGSNKSTTASTPSGGSSSAAPLKVGLVFDIGGRGDKSFNDAAAAGVTKAQSDLGVSADFRSTNATGTDRGELLTQLADAGDAFVIGNGFLFADSLGKVAKQKPNTTFAIVDDATITLPNVLSLTFTEEQGSYLVGAAAAMQTKSKHVGFIGGVKTPLLQKFEAGYVAGVHKIDPSIKVDVTYLSNPPDFSGFSAPDKGKTAAKGMLDSGADIVYAAAGGSGKGAFEAVKETGKKGTDWAIGVDSDQYNLVDAATKPYILTSMVKHVDVAVFGAIKAFQGGDKKGGHKIFDLKSGGVGYATSGGFVDQYKTKLDELSTQIQNGTIKVPTTP